MSPEDVELVRRSLKAFSARDVDELVGLSAEDCEWLPFRAQLEGIVY
jgi:ketosteroid isomerase-like protein